MGERDTMIDIKGQHTDAIIYTNNPQEAAIAQIEELVNQSFIGGKGTYYAGLLNI